MSCIMPTADRREFVPLALRYFFAQDYPARELIVVDDGRHAIGDLLPADPRVRYLRLERRATIGAKRNLACQHARGMIVAHWDDDDWQAPHRLSYQVGALLESRADVCGIATLLFLDPRAPAAWRYRYPPDQRFWLSGSSLCYAHAFWASHPFEDIDVGEDARFVWSGHPERMQRLADPCFHVGLMHAGNASPKDTGGPFWERIDLDEVRALLDSDWMWYAHGTPRAVQPAAPTADDPPRAALCVARQVDLALPEFVAFNHGQQLPWMRRWELPYVLTRARLSNTAAVLDCSINPVGLQGQLLRLYPHLLYRHAPPLREGRFVLPGGVPDDAFDAVICVNTLEHLLRPQREALVGAMARKLRAGGRLLFTSDYYFDSAWECPSFLGLGVMRADRSEVFNGWNRVTAAEWLALGAAHGLGPLGSVEAEEPREADGSLYRHPEPYPHAVFGGVLTKGEATGDAARRVVLAMLTWNTCDISLEAVRALFDEARLLRRLGHPAHVCVCDNGSTDGTPEALRALSAGVEVPHRLILNADNLGNAVARNQIVAYATACDADYILFTDGDLEIVPFSSFAMLRHLENSGHTLGCIGADSAGHTPSRQLASPSWYAVEHVAQTDVVAWTQYGMFRREVFAAGVSFDDQGAFRGAGWGFEDNDLAFQMITKGFAIQRFFGMTYLHQHAGSSIRIMRDRGIDAEARFHERRRYVVDKWSSVPGIADGPLEQIRHFLVLP